MFLHETIKQENIIKNELLLLKCNDTEKINQLTDIIKLNKQYNNYYIYNILTGELLQIICPMENLIKIINILINYKYTNINIINDDIFLEKNLNIKYKFFK